MSKKAFPKATYKTQGTIASASIEPNNLISFTIDPVEPYDFSVKEKGETEKYILFQSISNEKKWLAVKNTTEPIPEPPSNCPYLSKKCDPNGKPGRPSNPEPDNPNGKVEVETLLKFPENARFTLGNALTFSDLLQLKQNRTKVEIQIENYPEVDEKALSAVKVVPVSQILTK